MIQLNGHAALVTGSSKGIGRAIAEALAAAGADVVIHGLEPREDTEIVINRCRQWGVQVGFVSGDLSGPTEISVRHVFTESLKAQPSIDILVNNAGQYFDLPFTEMTLERFDKTLRLNVVSPYFLTQAFAKHWIEHKINGRVLIIGSINGRLAEPNSTAYDTSKGAIEMMVRSLCVALAPHGIRVNGLAPGLVRTPQTGWLDSRPDYVRWVAHHTPNGKIPDADVCGPAAVYLVGDAADHVHGQMLLVDGGMSALQQPAPI